MYSFEQTLSVRLIWPLVRLGGSDPWLTQQLEHVGLGLRDLTDAEARAPHGALTRLLQEAIVRHGDSLVGLRAGRQYNRGDLEALEQLSSTAPTLRAAIASVQRYQRLLHGSLRVELTEEGEQATWSIHLEETQLPAAVNDYALALAATFARAHTELSEPMLEVHVEHGPVAYTDEYRHTFGAPVRFHMPRNALVFRRALLDAPMRQANAALHAACELSAQAQLERLALRSGISGKVRELVTSQLRSGDTRMSTVADTLAMSVATLRRRLDDEGTSHTEILDQIRHALAKSYLRDPDLAISEISSLLGFAHVAAFYKAFRRWTDGATPAHYRAQMSNQNVEVSPDDRGSSRNQSA